MPNPFLTRLRWTGTVLRLGGTLPGPAAGPPPDAVVRLCAREGDEEHVLPAVLAEHDGVLTFEAAVPVTEAAAGAQLPGGLWDVDLVVGGEALPIGPGHDPALGRSPQRTFLPDSTTVVAYLSLTGPLALDVGGASRPAGTVRAEALAWDTRSAELLLAGHVGVGLGDGDTPVSATMALRERRTGRVYAVIAALDAAGERLGYTASVPMTRAFVDDPLPRGVWDAFLVLGFAGLHRELRIGAPEDAVAVRVWRRLRPVRVASNRAPDPLSITVGRG
ncbi:hypothetical protein [Actinomadura atramentaria]|uniref:hypothetical protein n=1 Tax=Actinomadura atramentaria TaxID=1990 RepID=UPI000374AEAE|nr:hypothetical protein [Actinomadura atramentaria]